MDVYYLFLILFNLSALGMYLFDAGIAFTVPAKMVEKRLMNEKTIDKISKLYGKKIYKSVRKDAKKDLNKVTKKITKNLTTQLQEANERIDEKIYDLIKNDIPHMLDERLVGLNNDMAKVTDNFVNSYANIMQEIGEIKGMMGSTLGASGNIAKEKKRTETLLMEEAILEANPNMGFLLEVLKENSSAADYRNKLKKYIKFGGLNRGAKEANREMPSLQQNALQRETSAEVQEKGRIEKGEKQANSNEELLNKLSEKEQYDLIRKECLNAGVPKKRIEDAIKKNKKLRKEQKNKESNENGEEKE